MKYSFIKAQQFFTPVKLSSFITIAIATLDNFNLSFLSIFEVDFLINFFIRIVMFSLGFFGIFGNGRTKRIRAVASSFAPLYLSIFYFVLVIKNHQFILIPAIAVSLLFSLWVLLFGDTYE